MAIRAIHRARMSGVLLLLPVAALVFGLAPSCGTSHNVSCSGGLQEHKGKCLTMTEIQYLDCIAGRGFSPSFEIGGGFDVVADRSLNLAYKKSQQEDTPVALQIVHDCFQLAGQQAQSPSDRAVAQSHASQAGQIIKTMPQRPVSDCQPDALQASIAEVSASGESPMTFELTITDNASEECTLREPVDVVEDDTGGQLGQLSSGGNITLESAQPASAGTFAWSSDVCPDGLTIDFTPAGASSAFQATMPTTECTSGSGSSSSSDTGPPSSADTGALPS